MKIKKGFMLRNIANNYIVVAVGEASKDFSGVINLNETGAFLWEKISNGCNEDQLVECLLEEYNVSEEVARNDVKTFVNKLKEANVVE